MIFQYTDSAHDALREHREFDAATHLEVAAKYAIHAAESRAQLEAL